MSSIPASATGEGRPLHSPAGAFSSVLSAAVGFGAAKLERKVVGWADKLDGVAGGADRSGDLAPLADAGLDGPPKGGGAAGNAAAEAVRAGLHGKNPIWAAISGAWRAGTPGVRAAIITAAAAAILLLLLSPVLAVLFLLSLLIIAAIHRAGAAQA
jgi:hypothetical protein